MGRFRGHSTRALILGGISVLALVPSVFGAPPPRGSDDLEFARGLQSRGYYDLAEDQYGRIRDDAAAKADDKVDALAGLAELYAETAAKSPEPPKRDELLGKACESLKRLIADYAQHPKAVPTHYRRGELLLEHGNLVGGMLTDADSADAKAKLKARGEPLFQEALKEFQQAAAEYGKDIAKREKAATTTKDKEALHAFRAPLLQALVQIGWTHYFRSKLYAEDKAAANAALDAGLKAFAEFTAEHRGYLVTLVAYRGQGLCAHYLGKYDDAIKAFDTILRTRPTSETATLRQLAYHHKAASCVASGKHDDAIRAVTSLYKEFPDLSGDIADAAIIEKGRALVAQAAQLAAQSAQFTKANKAKEAEQAGKDSATKYSLAIDSLKPISTRGGAWGRTATELIAKWTRDAGRKVEASAGELMAQAQALFGERKFLPAIQTCRQTIEAADPRKDYEVEAQAWFAMGHAFFEMKRPYESALAFTALADERPASPLASEAAYFAIQLFGSLYNESKDARDSGRYVESLRLLGRRFPQHPEASKVQFLAAEMSRAQGQYQEAASDYARVVAAAEEYEQASYLAGLCYWLEFVRQSERGEAGAKAAADVGPKAEQQLSGFLAWFADLPKVDPKRVPKAGPWIARTRLRLAAIYVDPAVKQPDKALALMANLAFPNEPDLQAETHYVLLQGHAQLSQVAQAEAALAALEKFEKFPQLSQAAYAVGRAYVEESKRKKAAGDAKAAVEAADRSARYLALAVQKRAEPRFQDFLWIAATLKELERYPQAIEMLRQTEQRFAAQAGDSIWDARRMIADCYIALQDWKGALDVFKQLVTKEPDVLVYRRELARCYENAGQYDDALREWRDVSQRAKGGTPDWYLSKYHLVANYCHKQNFPRAYEILSLTMDLHPDMGGPESAKKFKDLVQAKFPAEFKQKVAQLEAELAQGAKP